MSPIFLKSCHSVVLSDRISGRVGSFPKFLSLRGAGNTNKVSRYIEKVVAIK